MSLQISPSSSGVLPTQSVTPTAAAASSSGSTTVLPQYQIDFTGLTRASALGLADPTSAGDLELLFARISNSLKEALGDLADIEDVAQAERFRGRIGEALAAFDQMVRYGETIDVHNANVKKQDGIEAENKAISESAAGEIARLNSRRGEIETEIDTNQDAIDWIDGILITERNNLNQEAQGNITDERRTQISNRLTDINNWERDWARGEWNRLQTANTTLRTEYNEIPGKIAAKEQEKEDADANVAAAQASIKNSKTIIANTGRAMESFISNTIEVMLVAAGIIRSDMGRDSGQITTEGDSFESMMQDMARALVTLGALLNNQQLGTDVALNTSGAGLNQTQATPDRFGQLSAPIARAIAFAGMIAGVLGAVSDMLGNLSRGLGMQTAESFATQGEQRIRVGV